MDKRMGNEGTEIGGGHHPGHREWLLELRARIATDIADGRRSELVFEDLVYIITNRIDRSVAFIATIGNDEVPRVRASSAPNRVNHLIHGIERRQWFGAWSAAVTRQSEIIVPDISASSLYREHRRTFIDQRLLASHAAPLTGRHHITGGCLALVLRDARELDADEAEVFHEVASLAALALRREQGREEMLDRLRFDPLTGLENREGLEDRLRESLNNTQADGPGVGLLFVDIDDLTLINDSLGHAAGDAIIATTASRIRDQLMRTDHVVRFGGDEFIVILDRLHKLADARAVAERIRSSIGEPMDIADTTLTTTVSIGITMGWAGTSPLELIDEGHAAVVRAKQNGRSSTTVHDDQLDARASDRLDREQRLRQAVDNDEFVVFWQPKIDLATGRIAGAEALVRWRHPEKGILGPDRFIPTAERADLIDDLSDWVLNQAIDEAVQLTEHIAGFGAAINLSATQLIRPDIDYVIAAALERNSLRPDSLIIELTESTLANEEVVSRLYQLKESGLKLAIDDFGTGYSSLAYVRKLPVGDVKIDRAFLVGLKADGSGAPVLAAAVAMAHALGKSTTVEGIETSEQLAGLRALQVDMGQGYFFAEPQPLETLLNQIADEPRW